MENIMTIEQSLTALAKLADNGVQLPKSGKRREKGLEQCQQLQAVIQELAETLSDQVSTLEEALMSAEDGAEDDELLDDALIELWTTLRPVAQGVVR